MPDPNPKSLKEYHVFLASPGDVNEERQAVRDFFEEYNRTTACQWGVRFTVIDWDNYATASVGRPQELITEQTLERLKGSLALVIGLMAERFGSPTGTHGSGTVEEYEWALQHYRQTGWPEIKWFLRNIDNVSLRRDPDALRKAADQLEKVQEFRRKLQEPGPHQAYYKEFTNLRNFKDVLRNDLAMWLADPARPWAPARAASPLPDVALPPAGYALRQLPAPPEDFTGRRAEIDELMGKVRGGGVAISGLRGMGGIGKTALALLLAERLKDNYPDAQFFVNLRGTDTDPLTVADAMAQVIHGYHPEQRVPDSEAELRAMYDSVLQGQRALLLMDNAADAAQIGPLIPPKSCLLLVTSRRRFALPGLHPIDLDTLLPPEARELLLRIAPRIADQADEITRLCGYLPLALRLAGSALAARPDLTPADYVQRLANERQRLKTLDKLATDSSEGIEASIRLSEALLPEDLRKLWHALAVFPADFDLAAAAAVWELETDRAQDALSDLVRHSLAEFSQKTKRHRLHDLVRLYTNACLAEPARPAAQLRHAKHYCGVAALAERTYLKGAGHVLHGLAIFDCERPNIEAGFAWSAESTPAHDDAAELCSVYPAVAARCLNLRQHVRECIAWLDVALRAARGLGRRATEGRLMGHLGMAYRISGDPRRAIEYCESALEMTRDSSDQHAQAAILGNLGNAHADTGDPRQAIKCYEQQLAIVVDLGDRRAQGYALGNLGIAYSDLGDSARAVRCYEQVLSIVRETGDRVAESHVLCNLAKEYREGGATQRAIESCKQALDIACDVGDQRAEARVLGNLGVHYAAAREPAKAAECYERAVPIARRIGDRNGEALMGWNLGILYWQRGEAARCIDLMSICVDYLREIGHAEAEDRAVFAAELRAQLKQEGEGSDSRTGGTGGPG